MSRTEITVEYLKSKGWVEDDDAPTDGRNWWVLFDDNGEKVFSLDLSGDAPFQGFIGDAANWVPWPHDIYAVGHLEKIIDALTC